MPKVVRLMTLLSVALAVLVGSPSALAVDSGDIVIVSAKGEVHLTVNGAERKVSAGGVLEPPAALRTGRDGSIELKQGATTVSVGPETLLEFPALEKRGAPIDRIVQPRGNAFYSIGKREGRKLRVESPYLVGVIKGTQFNVAVDDDSTTISLFEGLLDVRTADGSAAIDLRAGEIASRKRGDKSISVLKMDGGKGSPTAPRAPAGSGSNNGTPRPAAPGPGAPSTTPLDDGDRLVVDRSPIDVAVTAGTSISNDIEVGTNAAINVVDVAVVGASADADVGAGRVDVSSGTNVDVGPVTVDVAASTGVDAGAGSVDIAAGANVVTGPIAVDVGAGAGVDLTAGTIETTVNTGLDAAPLTTDVGTTTSVDLGSGSVNTTVDASVAAPLVQVDVGANVVADVAAGSVNLGLDLAGVDLNLGVDLGLDDGNNGHGNDDSGSDSSNPGHGSDNRGPGNNNLGDLLDGLLHPRRKK